MTTTTQATDLTGKELDEANHALNTAPRVAIFEAAMTKARADYMRTRNDYEYDQARYAAFAAYDAAA